ncbi:hypothetical protein KBB42_01955 [Candidatus Dojkabacteria bacterium]|nr:hypothetical protein [Candidatus Dojkabacteria bacterium]
MENINNMSAEMIESKEQTESQKRNGYKVIALILLFIIAALLGAFSYLYVKGNIILKFPLFETQKVIEDKDLETKEEEKKR